MGTWNIGNQWGEIDEETALATVRSAFEHGINLFDTAESYGIPCGLSEERLGKALEGIRDRVHKFCPIVKSTGDDEQQQSKYFSITLRRRGVEFWDRFLLRLGVRRSPPTYLVPPPRLTLHLPQQG